IAGVSRSGSTGGSDIILIQTDFYGNIVSQTLLGGSADDTIDDMIRCADGGFLLAGTTWSFGAGEADIWVMKLGSSLSVEWEKAFGGAGNDSAAGCVEAENGDFYIIGNTMSFGSGESDLINITLTQEGELDRAYAMGKSFNERAEGVILNAGTSCLIYGQWQKTSGGIYAAFLYLADYAVDIETSVSIESGINMYCRSAYKIPDSGFIALIETGSYTTGEGQIGIMAVRVDEGCDLLWQKSFYGSSHSYPRRIIGGYNDHCMIAGFTGSFGAGNNDFWLLDIALDGTLCNEFTLGSSGQDYCADIITNRTGGFSVLGKSTSFDCASYGIILNTFDSSFSIGSSSIVKSSSSASSQEITRSFGA
ncbi:MAG: hypothetical protein ACRCUT_09020, partial [Spirochaetota bacterium]